MGQLVIAWTIHQPGLTHALVGARTEQQVIENAKGGSITLTPEELEEISAALAGFELA
jgi:aryl-alcohol dehydrogenase-like predicted oxidoreductase